MTTDEYEQLPTEEKEHFAKCQECGEMFDRRSLDEVLFHTDHTPARHSIFRLGKAKSRHYHHLTLANVLVVEWMEC
jgi:hypothetical protein